MPDPLADLADGGRYLALAGAALTNLATVAAGQAPAATTRPIRITVDLDPDRHRRLKIWAATHGVRSAEVIRALIALLDANPALAHAITDQITRDRDSLR